MTSSDKLLLIDITASLLLVMFVIVFLTVFPPALVSYLDQESNPDAFCEDNGMVFKSAPDGADYFYCLDGNNKLHAATKITSGFVFIEGEKI